MSSKGWRNLCFLFVIAGAVHLWRDCDDGSAAATAQRDGRPDAANTRPMAGVARDRAEHGARKQDRRGEGEPSPEEHTGDGLNIAGFTVPSWAIWLAPHPGEDLRSYRDRMLPISKAAIAPQRARVARSRDAFAQLAGLDDHQRAELDAAAHETAAAVEDRVMAAVLGGELSPATFKPMAGVGLARELLELVGRGNQRFLAGLREDQRAKLAQHPFDFGDYLVFGTPWEEALRFLD